MYLWFLIILLLIVLLWYYIPKWFSIQEGMDDYKEYDTNDPNNALILSQQNAGNIQFLKTRVDDLAGINDKVTNLQSQVDQMSQQIDDLVQQQADYAQDLAGDTPADVTGTDLTEDTGEEDNVNVNS